jgi:DNA-binding Lrp family transcriptional regulator
MIATKKLQEAVATHGSFRAAAKVLGVDESTVRRRLARGDDIKILLREHKTVNDLCIKDGSVIIGSDAHYSPGLVTTAHKAFCNVIAEFKSELRAIILNGDLLDGGRISRHGRIGWQKTFGVKDELEAVQERTGEIESVAGALPLFRTQGNHDLRFDTRLSQQAPEYEGVAGFALADHLSAWHDSYRVDINDDTKVIHAVANGMHAAYNNVVKGAGFHVVTGHTHRLQAVQFRGFGKLRYGIETGMLADPEQNEFYYLTGRNANWQSGFAYLTWRDGEMLYPEFCAVRDDGKAYFRGLWVA